MNGLGRRFKDAVAVASQSLSTKPVIFADDGVHRDARSHVQAKVQGLAFVKAGDAVTNQCPISAELRLLKDYLHEPLDGAALHVSGSAAVSEGFYFELASQSSAVTNVKPGSFCFQAHFIDAEVPLSYPIVAQTSIARQARCVKDVIDKLPAIVLVLPEPYAVAYPFQLWFSNTTDIFKKRLARNLQLSFPDASRKSTRIQHWPEWPANECRAQHGLHLLDSHAGSISSVMFMQLAHDLRMCAHRLHQPEGAELDSLLEDDSGLLLKVLGAHVDRLERWAKALDNPKLVALD
eukprot:6459897-Amphidinium_carterae.1